MKFYVTSKNFFLLNLRYYFAGKVYVFLVMTYIRLQKVRYCFSPLSCRSSCTLLLVIFSLWFWRRKIKRSVAHLVQKNELFIYTVFINPVIQKKNLRKIKRKLGKERTVSKPHRSLTGSVVRMIYCMETIIFLMAPLYP